MVSPRSFQLDVGTAWAVALLLIAALPILVMGRLVVPAAATVRLVPAGTAATSPYGIVAGGGTWPALVVTLVAALLLGLAAWRLRATTRPSPARGGREIPGAFKRIWGAGLPAAWLGRRGKLRSGWSPSLPEWTWFLLWGAFGVGVFNVLTRP
jgi:hypothetical protein